MDPIDQQNFDELLQERLMIGYTFSTDEPDDKITSPDGEVFHPERPKGLSDLEWSAQWAKLLTEWEQRKANNDTK